MKLTVVCVGKLKEPYLKDAIAEYAKRLSRYCKFGVVELAESKNTSRALADIARAKEEEGERILHALGEGEVVVLDLGGKEIASEELADYVGKAADRGKDLYFVIGGSDGLSPAVLERADLTVRFGRITLPHQLCRVVLSEQIYRAFCIVAGSSYHK